MFKKLTCVCVLVCLVLSLTGCGDKSKIELGQYKGITYTPMSTEVLDAELEAALNNVVQKMTTYETIADRDGTAVKDGDLLLIDYSGKLKESGEEFSGGTAKEQQLEIGSGKFIEGFEEQLIGKTVGETYDIEVTFPEDYEVSPALAGKEAIFTVKIHHVQETIIPELTDDLIAEYTENAHTTVESYREYCREYLQVQKEEDARTAKNQEVLKKVIDGTTFVKVSEEAVEDYYNSMVDYYKTIAEYMSLDLETYVSYYYGKSMEEFYAEIRKVADDTVREQLVLDAIIEAEGIKLSDEDYDKMIQGYMEQYGYTDQKEFEEVYTVKKLRESMLYDKAIDFIMEHAVAE